MVLKSAELCIVIQRGWVFFRARILVTAVSMCDPSRETDQTHDFPEIPHSRNQKRASAFKWPVNLTTNLIVSSNKSLDLF